MRSKQLNSAVSVLFLTIGLSLLSKAPVAQAHGAVVEVNPAAVEIRAAFDTGEPMSDAQVAVYAPTDPEMPVAVGQTDGEGRFVFSPDATAATESLADGRWEVTVRKAGHGQTAYFELGNGILRPASDPSVAQSRFDMQHWISIAAIIWGFIGTALYFKSRSKPTAGDQAANRANGHTVAVASDSRSDR
ncbi:MAG: carboxypeptidase regulatory-like domain-containing protein [Cyanobacteria bacterium P01_D01_bin.1]